MAKATLRVNRRMINSKLRHQFDRQEYRVYNQDYEGLIRKLKGDEQTITGTSQFQQTMLTNQLDDNTTNANKAKKPIHKQQKVNQAQAQKQAQARTTNEIN